MTRSPLYALILAALLLTITCESAFTADSFASHPPMRPLPTPSSRALPAGPKYFVSADDGDDALDGSLRNPWRSINHALRQLGPGDTLILRGGTYYEHIDVPVSGEEGRPITVRSYPGELAVVDGGLREFYDQPQASWQPLKEGAEHEYVSTRMYPAFAERPILNSFLANGWEPFYGIEDQRPVVQGNFADSMVPLHGYRSLADLRDESMLWDVVSKFDETQGVYCGPGLWYNRQTGRIHIRLAHTTLKSLGELAYRGETDPRKLPLVISGPIGADVLRVNGVRHLVFQDLVLRGASGSPLINLYGAEDITFDGLTVYGGSPGLLIKATGGLKMAHCAFRGLAAPWSSRSTMKYRGTPSYVILTQRNKPASHDFEFAGNEFTDGHDFAWLRYVKNLKFHHNFVDNFNDDGLEVGAKKRDQELYIYQNLVRRSMLTFTLHEMDKDDSPAEVDPGSGVYITRNILDLRQGNYVTPRRESDPIIGNLQLCGDHGGPVWPHYYFYHNTVLRSDSAWRGYYGFGMGGRGLGKTTRRVFNNIFVQLAGIPDLNITLAEADLVVDGNLHWGVVDGPSFQGDFFQKQGRSFAFRKLDFPANWMKHDQFTDPRFTQLETAPHAQFDITLQSKSPAINAGVELPAEWFDPLREQDQDQPDLGAIPHGLPAWQVGIHGRIGIQ